MRETTGPLRVVIAGGGIAGLTFARLCLGAGMQPIVLERRPLEDMLSGPGGIFIQANAMSVYRERDPGLMERMYTHGGRVLAGGFYSSSGAPLYINRPRFVGREDLGVCLKRSRLQELLCEDLPAGTVRAGVAVADHQEGEDGVVVTTSTGERLTAHLLVGADGIHSQVRARLLGLEQLSPAEYAGFTCWRATFDGREVPFEPGTSWGECWGRGARLGWFAIGGGRYAFYAFQNRPAGERE